MSTEVQSAQAGLRSVIQAIADGTTTAQGIATFYQGGTVVRLPLAELDDRASRVATWLAGQGLAAGQRIGILAQNSLEWVLLDLAALKLGVVTAGFELGTFRPSPDLLDRYELELLFTSETAEGARIVDIASVAEARSSERYRGARVKYAPSDYATIKFTSGSTGVPKGLGATVGSVDSSLAAVQELFVHGPSDKLLVFLPLSLLQQRYWVYSALAFGHDVVVTSHALALYACKEERPTVVMGVPAFFESVMRQVENKARRESNGAESEFTEACRQRMRATLGDGIRYLWTGSAPAKPNMLQFYSDLGFPIFEGYGMNETCIVTKNTPNANRVGSVGRVLPRKRIRIEQGVLIVSSDHPVGRRYLYCSEEAQSIFRDNGDVVTGDLARIDEDGYLYILGRSDEIVSLANGKNVHVRSIEDWLKANAGIEQCIVLGTGSNHLKVVISPGDREIDRDAIACCVSAFNQHAASHERIGEFVVADEAFSVANGLLSSQGKPKRAKFREIYGS